MICNTTNQHEQRVIHVWYKDQVDSLMKQHQQHNFDQHNLMMNIINNMSLMMHHRRSMVLQLHHDRPHHLLITWYDSLLSIDGGNQPNDIGYPQEENESMMVGMNLEGTLVPVASTCAALIQHASCCELPSVFHTKYGTPC
jgi:hypothetical protein